MKILRTEITTLINESLYIDLRSQPFIHSPFHSHTLHLHPELELVFILEGFGKWIIGNRMETFKAGDMVFIGSNVPHMWQSDPVFYKENSNLQSKIIVIYFSHTILDQLTGNIKEFDSIGRIIQKSSKGIRIDGKTRDLISKILLMISGKTGFDKVEGIFKILYLISISQDIEFIVDDHIDNLPVANSDKLITVLQFIQANFQEPLTLKQVAEIACLTEQSFCRFFRSRTKKSFSQYLLNLRINHAQKLLIELDKPISDIANLCGYNSISYFCKVFKEYTGQSPYKYKRKVD